MPRAHQVRCPARIAVAAPAASSLMPRLLCHQLSIHLAAGACFSLHQITIHGTSLSSAVYVGLVGHRHCFARPGRAARAVTCRVISWAWRGIAWRRRWQLTVPSDSMGLYRTVFHCTVVSTVQDNDARPVSPAAVDVSLSCLARPGCPACTCALHTSSSAPSEPLGRPPCGRKLYQSGSSYDVVVGCPPSSAHARPRATRCFLHVRIARTDHHQRHLRSGLDTRMSQCNAMQCRAGESEDGKHIIKTEGERMGGNGRTNTP